MTGLHEIVPAAFVTDTLLQIHSTDAFTADFAAHRAIQDWVRFHGLDPAQVMMSGLIHRDVEHCRVVYIGRVDIDEPGPRRWATCVQQGEAPPLPWPAELDKYRTSLTPADVGD